MRFHRKAKHLRAFVCSLARFNLIQIDERVLRMAAGMAVASPFGMEEMFHLLHLME